MNYQETIAFLFEQTPAFQQKGASAYKPGLDNTKLLDTYFEHPHTSFRTIHVGGTNGKGSSSHTLAAILQQAGYRVGLYTSPHLVDFRERIRVDGQMIDESYVVNFVATHFNNIRHIQPSFFELTMMMAFDYFRHSKVDIAIIEVGLGGRLDSTNIIDPMLSIITNISLDHTQFLGSDLGSIAKEKAGIIKADTPVIIGEYLPETEPVFLTEAAKQNAPIYFAQKDLTGFQAVLSEENTWVYSTAQLQNIKAQLAGECQPLNAATILLAIEKLQQTGLQIPELAIRNGFAHVCDLTGLCGRWQIIQTKPLVIADTAHNKAGVEQVVKQLQRMSKSKLHLILGFANDKDISAILSLYPKDANFYFTQASVSRALKVEDLHAIGLVQNIEATITPDVPTAYALACSHAQEEDLIFIGGSNFIVADFLAHLHD